MQVEATKHLEGRRGHDSNFFFAYVADCNGCWGYASVASAGILRLDRYVPHDWTAARSGIGLAKHGNRTSVIGAMDRTKNRRFQIVTHGRRMDIRALDGLFGEQCVSLNFTLHLYSKKNAQLGYSIGDIIFKKYFGLDNRNSLPCLEG